MPEIIKTYKQTMPKSRFIGKQHPDPSAWGEWFQNGWFELIEGATGGSDAVKAFYEDADAYIGLMSDRSGADFRYWIGMFVSPDTKVPEGFISIDFDEMQLGVCWIYGKENEVYMSEGECAPKLISEGMTLKTDENGLRWSFERYGCPRFTTPDDKGNITLDYCCVIE